MTRLFEEMDCVEGYIDDIAAFSNDLPSHMIAIAKILSILNRHNFSVKAIKCKWCEQIVPWLGHMMHPDGFRSDPEKIRPILEIKFPETVTQMRLFIGMLNFYRDFFQLRSHLMAQLTALTGKNNSARGKIKFTPQLELAFNRVKNKVTERVLLTFPDPNKVYGIYTDASDEQLGAVITQKGKVITFYSRKLTPTQKKYPTIDKEMLCIVETLKEYREILWGARIFVHTDHMNLTRQNISSPRIMTWQMVCEEFMPVFKYIKGDPDNSVADTLSRLPFLEPEKKEGHPLTISDGSATTNTDIMIAEEVTELMKTCYEDLFLNYPSDLLNFPLVFENVRQHQQQQQDIANNNNYQDQVYYGTTLKTITRRGITKIVLPTSLIHDTMHCYHHVLGHAGQERLYKSISQHMYCPGLPDRVAQYVRCCGPCQRYKNAGRGIAHVAPALTSLGTPQEEIAIDGIGSWKVQLPHPLNTVTFNAFTIIDTTTDVPEIIRSVQMNSTGQQAVKALNNAWLVWYFPGPLESRITPLQLQLQELLNSLGERHTKQIVGRLSLNIT